MRRHLLSGVLFHRGIVMKSNHAVQAVPIRTELQRQLRRAVWQYAFFRWENAVIVALTLLLTTFFPHPFAFWPVWGWPLFGILGMSALLVTSLRDREANTRLMLQLLEEIFDPRALRSPDLRAVVEKALTYQRHIEMAARDPRYALAQSALEDTAATLSDWLAHIYRLALQLDAYRHDALLARERESVPREIEELQQRLQNEQDPTVRRDIARLLESKEAQWRALQELDARMKRAELNIQESLTALATVYGQAQLIGSSEQDYLETTHMREQIEEQITWLETVNQSLQEVYHHPEWSNRDGSGT